MSHSTRVFTSIPQGYEKLAAMLHAGQSIEKCKKKLIQLMHDDELEVFNLRLSLEDYFASIAKLKDYLLLQQSIYGKPPLQISDDKCPVYASYQQLIYQIDMTLFTFIKDYYQWQPLALARQLIAQFLQPLQQDLILTAELPLASYIKAVNNAFSHWQQIKDGTLTVNDWLAHFTHVLAQPVATTSEEKEQQLAEFKKSINDLISRWYHYHQLLQDKTKIIALDELQDAVYPLLPVPSVESVMAYVPKQALVTPYVEPGTVNSFAATIARIGLLFVTAAQFGRAAGLAPVPVGSAMCLLDESNQSPVADPLRLMAGLSATPIQAQYGYPKTPPDKQLMPDVLLTNDLIKAPEFDAAILKRAETIMLAARVPVVEHAQAGMNPHEIAIANLGLNQKPAAIFKHYHVHESPELIQDNYMYAQGAAILAPELIVIPDELIAKLEADVNKGHHEAARFIREVKSRKKQAIYHVLSGYLYSNGLLKANNENVYEWSQIAAKLGNMLALQYLGERLYPFPDRDYALLMGDLGSQCNCNKEELAVEKALRLREGEQYLQIAAYWGHARASYLLGEAYQWGYYGATDKAKALSYFVQSIIQCPRKPGGYKGAIQAANSIIDVAMSQHNKIEQLSWRDFDAANYFEFYKKVSKVVKTLNAVVEQAEEVLLKRGFFGQRNNIAVGKPEGEYLDEAITQLRAALHTAKAKLTKLKLNLDDDHVLPSPANLKEFGVHFQAKTHGKPVSSDQVTKSQKTLNELRELAASGVAEASNKLALIYATGDRVTQNHALASFFYRQAILQQPGLAFDRQMHRDRIANEEARLRPFLALAMRVSQNPFKARDHHKQLVRLSSDIARTFGIQIPSQARPVEWSWRTVDSPQVATIKDLDLLQSDIEKMSRKMRQKYLRILSALRDGDYAETPAIVSLYAHNRERHFIWLTIAASHGHLPSLRLHGRILRENALRSSVRQADIHAIGVKHTAMAAAMGNFDATTDMIEIVENNEIDISPLGFEKEDLIWFYKSQCYRQDPQRALAALVDTSKDNAFLRAKYADGVNRIFKSSGEDLTWNRVQRDGSDKNVEQLFSLLKKHHPNPEAVAAIMRQFTAGDDKCFMQVAEYYMSGQVGGLSTISRQILAVNWAALGFRSGDIEAGKVIYGTSLNMHEMHLLTDDEVSLFSRIYADVYREFPPPPFQTTDEKLNQLATDSICFCAYYYDATASVVHAKVKSNVDMQGWQRLNLLSQSRALLAQAVMQGRNDWRIYFDFAVESQLVLELIKKESSEHVTKDLRFLAMEDMLFQDHQLELEQFLELALLKLDLEYSERPREEAEKFYIPYRRQINEVLKRYYAVEGFSLLKRYRDAGIRLPQELQVFDGMYRVHEFWERNLVPELRSPDFTIEHQYYLHSKTSKKLKGVTHPLLTSLEKNLLAAPKDLVAMHDLCAQHGQLELAASWLRHAARAGDPIAHRMRLMSGSYTHAQLAALAAHGEAGASAILADSENTPKEFRELLRLQADRLKHENRERDLHLPEMVRPKQVLDSGSRSGTGYFNYILVALLGFASLLMSIYGMRLREQYRKQKALAAKYQQKRIEDLLAQFRVMSHIHFHYDQQLQLVVATFQAAADRPSIRNLKHELASTMQFSENDKKKLLDPLLQRAQAVLRKANVIAQHEILSEDALLAMLGIKLSKNTKSQYSFKCTHHGDLHLGFDAGLERELFEVFVTMAGYSCVYQPQGVCHLQRINSDDVLYPPMVQAFCISVYDLVLRKHHQRIEKDKRDEADRLAEQQANEKKYQAALSSLKMYDATKIAYLKVQFGALREEMLNTNVKLARDVAQLCLDYSAKLDKCSEIFYSTDKDEVVLFEASITRSVLLLQDNHELRRRIQAELESKRKHAVEKPARNLDQYNGAKKRADKAKQDEEARKQAERKRSLEEAKKKVATVAPAPVVVAEAPVAEAVKQEIEKPKVIRDVADVDLSKMKVLTPKSTRFFGATASSRQPSQPPMRGLIIDAKVMQIIRQEDKVWPFDLIEHHRSLMKEILTDVAFMPKSCEIFRLRALSFRLMRYLLFLQSLNKDGGDEVKKVPATVRNLELRRSLSRFVNGIKHNFHLIRLQDLESCVRQCFLAETDDITEVIGRARNSSLCEVILPKQRNVVIARDESTIFAELDTYFNELKKIDTLYNKLEMNKMLDDACHDGYRGIIMMIGEVGQWLYQTCPQLKNEIFANYPELRNFMYFIVMCHVLHRNNYGHVIDLNAMYESSLADFPFVADNLYSAVLYKFVWHGIKVGCVEGLCEKLKEAYIATKQKMAEPVHHNARADQFEQDLKLSYVVMMDVRRAHESQDMESSSSPRMNN